jgi:hypothetical protein
MAGVLDVNKRSSSDCDNANMSATEIEKLVLAMPDADSDNVSDNLKSSMSVSVLSSIDNASIEHDYITPLLVSSLSPLIFQFLLRTYLKKLTRMS